MGLPYNDFIFSRTPLLIAGLLLSVHAALLGYAATRHSPTLNEQQHLVAGISHWQFGRFELYRVNPPLVRMVATLPVLAVPYEEDWSGFYDHPGARPIFSMGDDFFAANGYRTVWLITIARWACIPFSITGGIFCYLWSRELWKNDMAGLLSLTLWCFEPNILAHAELLTPDCAATTFGLGASYLFWRWLKIPTWSRTFAAGIVLGLAQLAKMSWVILFGLWPLIIIIYCGWVHNRGPKEILSTRCLQMLVILATALYIINMGYGFDETFRPLGKFQFVSKAFSGTEHDGEIGNRFEGTWLEVVPVPLPKQYLIGMDVQKRDFENYGHLSYLGGEWKDGGWWYYYIYGLLVKTTHGMQLLFLLAILAFCCFPAANSKTTQIIEYLPFLLPPSVLLTLVSSQMEFNHHLRYVLPIYGFAFVFIGVLGRYGLNFLVEKTSDDPPVTCGPIKLMVNCKSQPIICISKKVFKLLVVLLLCFTIGSSMYIYPNSLAYFNEISGGSKNGFRHLLHSNYDWGQDALVALDWVKSKGLSSAEVEFCFTNPSNRFMLKSGRCRSTPVVRIVSIQEMLSTNHVQDVPVNATRVSMTMWAIDCRKNRIK